MSDCCESAAFVCLGLLACIFFTSAFATSSCAAGLIAAIACKAVLKEIAPEDIVLQIAEGSLYGLYGTLSVEAALSAVFKKFLLSLEPLQDLSV